MVEMVWRSLVSLKRWTQQGPAYLNRDKEGIRFVWIKSVTRMKRQIFQPGLRLKLVVAVSPGNAETVSRVVHLIPSVCSLPVVRSPV